MNAIIYFSSSKQQRSKKIAEGLSGDVFQIKKKGRQIKSTAMQMFYYGYLTMLKRNVKIEVPKIDFDQYDTITLVSPVWAGRVGAFMRQFLQQNQFTNKQVHIIGTCEGGYEQYFDSFNEYLHPSNTIVETTMFVKGVKVEKKRL